LGGKKKDGAEADFSGSHSNVPHLYQMGGGEAVEVMVKEGKLAGRSRGQHAGLSAPRGDKGSRKESKKEDRAQGT